MLFEIKGICQNCKENVDILVYDGKPTSKCSCKKPPFLIKKFRGLVYIVKNRKQTGVKIGQTSKTIEERCKQLASTGVHGKFEPIAIFPSTHPKKDEKKAHEKFLKKKIEKEHFDLAPIDAVLKVHKALNKKEPIFYDEKIKNSFFS